MNKIAVISENKADRLYWLGRYTQRAYLCLHFLRNFYDRMIDGRKDAYQEYCDNLGLENDNENPTDFFIDYLYNKDNCFSIISLLNFAMNNAIELREEITTESLAYLELCCAKIRNLSILQESNITSLQSITDYILALWGSLEERIQNDSVLAIINSGKMVEYIDMHQRFNYPMERINTAKHRLKKIIDTVPQLENIISLPNVA